MNIKGKIELRFAEGKYHLVEKNNDISNSFITFNNKLSLEDFLSEIFEIHQDYFLKKQAKSKVVYVDFRKKIKNKKW